MSERPGITYIRAEGDARTIGCRHGHELAGPLQKFVVDSLCRLNKVMPSEITLEELSPRIAAYDGVITAVLPDLAEEITGLAEGAGIGREQALLLQLRREIMGYSKIPSAGDCTTYARSGVAAGGNPVLAQTVDLNGDLDDHISVLDIAGTGSSPRRVLMLSFAGLLGYLGVNSDGLAVGLNLVIGGEWRPGVPPYLAIRHVLDTAGCVDEAVEVLRGLPLASSRSFMLCDAAKSAYVETHGDRLEVVEAPEPVHTNHYLHPDFAAHDELNVFARNSSRRRLEAGVSGLVALAPDADVAAHFELLSAPPICVPGNGDIRRERTVAAVVMFPARGELHVRPGDPSLAATQTFALT